MSPELEDDVLGTARAGNLVIRGSAQRVVGYGLGTLAAVVSTAVLLRHLSVEDAGRYNTVVALLAVVGGLVDAGMTNIGLREWARRTGEDRSRVMRDLLGVRVAITVAGVVVAVGVAALAGYTAEMIAGTALAGVGLILLIVANTLQIPLGAELQLGAVAAIDVLRNVFTAVLIAGLAIAGAGLVTLLAVPLPVGIALVAVAGFLVRGRMPRRPAVELERWRVLLADALPYAVATAVGFIYLYMTVILLGFVSSDYEVGIFSAAFRVFIVLGGVAGLVQQSAFPVLARAARDDRDRLHYAVQRLLDGSLVLGGMLALATAVGAPIAIDAMAGARFEASVPVLRIQGAALMMTFLAALTGFALLSMHRYRAVLIVNALALVTSIVFVLVLGAADGATGAAWANLAGETVLSVAGLVALARGTDGVRLRYGSVLRVAPALAVGVAVALLVPGGAVVETAAAVVACGLVMILTRAVPEEILLARRR
jgi:O-antigen/teichoic acid export membrane protein